MVLTLIVLWEDLQVDDSAERYIGISGRYFCDAQRALNVVLVIEHLDVPTQTFHSFENLSELLGVDHHVWFVEAVNEIRQCRCRLDQFFVFQMTDTEHILEVNLQDHIRNTRDAKHFSVEKNERSSTSTVDVRIPD